MFCFLNILRKFEEDKMRYIMYFKDLIESGFDKYKLSVKL